MNTTLVVVERQDQAVELNKLLPKGSWAVAKMGGTLGRSFDALLMLCPLVGDDELVWYHEQVRTRLSPAFYKGWFV